MTVIWDPDLVPKSVAQVGAASRPSIQGLIVWQQPYDYPAPPERVNASVTRQTLAEHFAAYNRFVAI